jgi:histidinol-phosphate aminotransferase
MQLRSVLSNLQPYIEGKTREGAIKLSSNENVLGSSPKAMANISGFLNKIYYYPDSRCSLLKEKLAKKYGVSEDMIILGNGSDEIFLFVSGAYMESGCNAVTSEATFSEYSFATKLFGGEVRLARMENYRYSLDNIKDLMDGSTRIVFIANPNNPTGTYVTRNELEKFIKSVPSHVLVLIDEAYFEYVTEKDFPDSMMLAKSYQNVLVARTFSKIYGLAGLRIGYAIGSAKIISDLLKTKEPFNINSVAQVAALGALDDAEFVKSSMEMNEAGKKYLYSELDSLKIEYVKTSANFILMRTGKSNQEAFNYMLERGIAIRPLPVLNYSDTIRVTIGKREHNELFIKLLKEFISS